MAREPIGVGDDSRLPRRVREQLAAEVADASTEVGAAVSDTIAGSVGALNDPAVAGLIDDPESATNASLSATFGMVSARSGESPSQAVERLNAAIQDAPLGFVKVTGSWSIDAPVIVPTGRVVDFTGATVTLVAGSDCNMLQNSAVTRIRTGAGDAVVDAAAKTVTSTAAAFTASDIGRHIAVSAVGFAGMNAYGTITAVSGNVATFEGSAMENQTGGNVEIYERDSDIQIFGGTWDRGTNVGVGWHTHSLRLRRVDRLVVSGQTVITKGGKYAISLGDVTDYRVSTVHFDSHSDGLHVQGPALRGSVSALYGSTDDDLLGITSTDYLHYNDVFGDIDGLEWDGLFPDGGLAALKIIGGTGSTARNIRGRGISGTTQIRPVAIIGDNVGPSHVSNVVVDGISVDVDDPLAPLVLLAGYGDSPLIANNIEIRNAVYRWDGTKNPRGVVHVTSDVTTVTDLLVDRAMVDGPDPAMHILNIDGEAVVTRPVVRDAAYTPGKTTGNALQFGAQAVITDPEIDGLDMQHAASGTHGSVVNIDGGVTVAGALHVRRVRATRSNGVMWNKTTGAVLVIKMDDVYIEHPSGGSFIGAYGPVEVHFGAGVVAATTASGVILSNNTGATARVYGAPRQVTDLNHFHRVSGTATCRAYSPNFRVRSDWAEPATDGQHHNTLSSLAHGVGPCVSDGTSWKNAYSGAVYTP